MEIRAARLDEADLDAITRHRSAMFRDMGYIDERTLDELNRRFRVWLRKKMEAGEYLGWFALAPDSSIVSGVGVWLMDWPPHVIGSGVWRANILNVYTDPPYRRSGLSRALVETAIDWCSNNSIDTVILHASDQGRALYESLGFRSTNEMRLIR